MSVGCHGLDGRPGDLQVQLGALLLIRLLAGLGHVALLVGLLLLLGGELVLLGLDLELLGPLLDELDVVFCPDLSFLPPLEY